MTGEGQAAGVKILHILFEAPIANGSGAQQRSRALGNALRRSGDVTTLVLQDQLSPDTVVRGYRESRIVLEVPGILVDVALTAARNLAPDLIVIEAVQLADVAHRLVDAGYRVVLDAHNVESALLCEIDRAKRGFLAPIRYKRRWLGAVAAETSLVKRVTAVWACSARDASQLEKMASGTGSIAVVPNPIPEWCHTPPSFSSSPGIRALFVGHLGYRPNIRVVERIAHRILPRLRADMPDAIVTIAGRTPHQRCRVLDGIAGLDLLPDPPEVASLYAQSNMAIIPLTEGGGTRIKVLEAMACGLPVIATAKAVEGLELAPGRHFLLAETDFEFVTSATDLARNSALQVRIRQNALDFVTRHHGAKAIDAAVSQALRRTLEIQPGE